MSLKVVGKQAEAPESESEADGYSLNMKPLTLAGILILISPLLAFSCRQAGEDGSGLPPGAQAQSVEIGSWGGDQVAMDVAETGATLEFSCAHGTIAGALLLDDAGGFAADGLYFQEHGGPISDKDVTQPVKARYEGNVAGDSMSLTIINLDTQEKIGAFNLGFGAAAKINKCL